VIDAVANRVKVHYEVVDREHPQPEALVLEAGGNVETVRDELVHAANITAHSSSSTSGAPPATRSPSATFTLRTTASYGETRGVSIFIASSTTSGWWA
jgi:hypothetical protein